MDGSLALTINHFALHFKGILPLFADWMVYILLITSTSWIALHHLGRIRLMVIDFLYTLAAPLLLAVVISEGLSKIFDRARPFVANKEITLIIPHDADGGFPSHHMTVMAAIAMALIYRNHVLGRTMMALALLSGFARIGAGIHYPTDILAGLIIGAGTSILLHRITKEARLRALRS